MMEFFTNCIIEDYKRLENCWAYISAQSAAVVSPGMFEEFIQPYHERIAEIFGKVYYHGCEDLTQKAGIISSLPNLRRFHISPWSNVDTILDKLGNKFVDETHVHPTNYLFLHDDERIQQDIRELALKCRDRGVTADINLSDIETINNNPDKLVKWARLAREAVDGLL